MFYNKSASTSENTSIKALCNIQKILNKMQHRKTKIKSFRERKANTQ